MRQVESKNSTFFSDTCNDLLRDDRLLERSTIASSTGAHAGSQGPTANRTRSIGSTSIIPHRIDATASVATASVATAYVVVPDARSVAEGSGDPDPDLDLDSDPDPGRGPDPSRSYWMVLGQWR